MKTNSTEMVKPAIKLLYSTKTDLSLVNLVLYGAEEEGIPVEAHSVAVDNALALGIVASKISTLGTGIGLSSTEAVVHYEKLPPRKPVYATTVSAGAEALRRAGINGARLVKRMPLRIE